MNKEATGAKVKTETKRYMDKKKKNMLTISFDKMFWLVSVVLFLAMD